MTSATAEPEVTPAAEWRRSQGVLVPLPSGNVIRMLRPGLPRLLREGLVPPAVVPLVKRAMDGHPPSKDEAREVVEAIDAMYDRVAVRCVVEPRVRPIPEDGRRLAPTPGDLYVDQLADDDRIAIWQAAAFDDDVLGVSGG